MQSNQHDQVAKKRPLEGDSKYKGFQLSKKAKVISKYLNLVLDAKFFCFVCKLANSDQLSRLMYSINPLKM